MGVCWQQISGLCPNIPLHQSCQLVSQPSLQGCLAPTKRELPLLPEGRRVLVVQVAQPVCADRQRHSFAQPSCHPGGHTASCGLASGISPGHSKAQRSRDAEQAPWASWLLWLSHFPERGAETRLCCRTLFYSYALKLPAVSFILLFQGSVCYLQSYR